MTFFNNYASSRFRRTNFWSLAVKNRLIRFETSNRTSSGISASARISTSLPKKLEIELKSDFHDNLDLKWFLKVSEIKKKWYQISYYSSDNFDPEWPCVDPSSKLMSHYLWAIWYGNSLFRYALEIKNPLRHSRSPQNRYNIPVKGISGTSSVTLSSTETYRL